MVRNNAGRRDAGVDRAYIRRVREHVDGDAGANGRATRAATNEAELRAVLRGPNIRDLLLSYIHWLRPEEVQIAVAQLSRSLSPQSHLLLRGKARLNCTTIGKSACNAFLIL